MGERDSTHSSIKSESSNREFVEDNLFVGDAATPIIRIIGRRRRCCCRCCCMITNTAKTAKTGNRKTTCCLYIYIYIYGQTSQQSKHFLQENNNSNNNLILRTLSLLFSGELRCSTCQMNSLNVRLSHLLNLHLLLVIEFRL